MLTSLRRSVVLWIILGACRPAASPQAPVEVLRFSAIPDIDADEQARQLEPLRRYLEAELGTRVEYVPTPDYAATVDALAQGKVHLAWLGGLTFLQARSRTSKVRPLVQRAEDAAFTSKVIASARSGITRLAELSGKTVAFGARLSTSGHLMPRYFLAEKAGLVPERDFGAVMFSGAHDRTARAVEGGQADAGVLSSVVWDRLVNEGKVDVAKVRAIYTTPAYHDYTWTVRTDLPAGFTDRLRQAFLGLDGQQPVHRMVLEALHASRFVETAVEPYEILELAARQAQITYRRWPDVLKLTSIPDVLPEALHSRFEPLRRYLEQALAIDVEFVPSSSYDAAVSALVRGEAHLAWLGGLTFVQAQQQRGDLRPIVQRAEDAQFRSVFIAGAKSGIEELAQLRGKSFCFGARLSTSGHVMPRHFLREAALVPEVDFASVTYSGSHSTTVEQVVSGRADAGVLSASAWDELVQAKRVDPAQVRAFFVTPTYFDYNWTVRGDLPLELIELLTQAFLELDPDNQVHKVILELQRASRFIPSRPENYAHIAAVAERLNLSYEPWPWVAR